MYKQYSFICGLFTVKHWNDTEIIVDSQQMIKNTVLLWNWIICTTMFIFQVNMCGVYYIWNARPIYRPQHSQISLITHIEYALQWRHNQCNDGLNHWCLDGLLNRLLRRISKNCVKELRVLISTHVRNWLFINEYTVDNTAKSRTFNSSPLDKMAAISTDDNFKCILLNENERILIRISLNLNLSFQLTISQHWLR